MSLSFLLALRFLRSSKDEKNISAMMKVCFISILLSTFALTLVMAIMNGYEKVTHDKLKGIHADVILSAQGKAIDFEKVSSVVNTKASSFVEAMSPVALGQIIAQSHNKQAGNVVCALKGIDPINEPKVSALKNMITDTSIPKASWPELLKDNGIFIGEKLAKQLEVKVGDTLTLLYGDDMVNNKITLDAYAVKVAAFFKTGINEFDEYFIVTSLHLFNELFNHGISQINVKLKDDVNERDSITQLKEIIPLEINSWKELYPALVSALALERYAMILILTLVALIASMNIISLLFMIVTQKRMDIAILKSMGFANSSLMFVFTLLGVGITFCASFCGIVMAVLAAWFLNHYPLISLPDIYYTDTIYAQIEIAPIIVILIASIILSAIATLLPSFKIKNINIAHLLKNGVT